MSRLVLVGGGLANGLIALRLVQRRPDVDVVLLESGSEIGGNHTWSFHEGDLTQEQLAWLAPLTVHSWPHYEMRFPALKRRIETGYRSVTSERFVSVLRDRLGSRIRTDAPVAEISADGVTLAAGERIAAGGVVDGRGVTPSRHLQLGYQKFLGREIRLAAPHGLAQPIIMDATVPQSEGYRFVYVLPLDDDRLLVEDTYYADGEGLEIDRLRGEIDLYLQGAGWVTNDVLREEVGVLPIALGGNIAAFWDEKGGVAASGLAAALFHPTTGYSLPDAVRLAELVAGLPDLSGSALHAATRAHSVRTWSERGFFRGLNRMLFLAGPANERYRVLQHFHRLPTPLIARFYAGRLTALDRLRILTGKPPVPVLAALRALAAPLGGPFSHPSLQGPT